MNCRVQAGKFYAAVGEHDKAVDPIDSAFRLNFNGKERFLESCNIAFPWAIYNYGRALWGGGKNIKNFHEQYNGFQARFDAVRILSDYTDDALIERLKRLKVFYHEFSCFLCMWA